MKIFTLLLTLSFLFIFGNDVTVDKNLKVSRPKLCFDGFCAERMVSRDEVSGDTINISSGNIGHGGYIFQLNMIKNIKTISIVRWEDYPAYNGKSSVELPIKKYSLVINKDHLKVGDTLKAKFSLIVNKSKYSIKKKIEGEIYHIIDGNRFVWNGVDYYRDEFYKNGFPSAKRDSI